MLAEIPVAILGAGLAGMSAARVLEGYASTFEQSQRPGGLVISERVGDYWFDHVLHLLYFADTATALEIRSLLGDVLTPCQPRAWVETAHGNTRFPFQLNLSGLPPEHRASCLQSFEEEYRRQSDGGATNFQDHLLRSFGRGMCELFLYPYNRKMWKRSLAELAPSGFVWNIVRPDIDAVRAGAQYGSPPNAAYNSAGWYPVPPRSAKLRGMEVVSQALAASIRNLFLAHRVVGIDLPNRTLTVASGGATRQYRYRHGCVSSIPLPDLVALCVGVPDDIREACKALLWNRVVSTAVCIRGPRPVDRGHWRYYADESLAFNRLVYMHEFDPHSAPEDGWGLLVEMTEPAESELVDDATRTAKVRADLARVGALPGDCEIVQERSWIVDPAYVVFTNESRQTVDRAVDFLHAHGVHVVGRYGRWEYSSMGQVIRDGTALGTQILHSIRSDCESASKLASE